MNYPFAVLNGNKFWPALIVRCWAICFLCCTLYGCEFLSYTHTTYLFMLSKHPLVGDVYYDAHYSINTSMNACLNADCLSKRHGELVFDPFQYICKTAVMRELVRLS